MIRDANPADAPACAAILNRWIDATPWMPRVHPADSVMRHYRQTVLAERRVWIDEVDGDVAGFLALSGDGDVTALYLAEGVRRQGRGARLLDRAKEAREALTLWTFQANEGAQRFYLREGFAEVTRTEGDNEEGLPDILYRWAAP